MMLKTLKTLYLILISSRPRQWLKNLSVLQPFFRRSSFKPKRLPTRFSFIVFIILSSSVYLFNDVVDAKADKVHFQKNRPVASGLLSKKLPYACAVLASVGVMAAVLISNLVLFSAILFLANLFIV